MPRRIFFDISDVLVFAKYNDRVSGIQRVVLSLLGRLSKLDKDRQIQLIAYHPGFDQVMLIKTDLFGSEHEYSSEMIRDHFFLDIRLTRRDLNKPGRFLRHAFAFHKLRWAMRLGLSSKYRAKIQPAAHRHTALFSPAELTADDIIFLPGAFWGIPPFRKFLQQQHKKGVRIYTFIHDLIPLVLPDIVDGELSEIFERDLREFAELTTRFYVNSQSTKRDLERFISALPLESRPGVTVIPLAHEFPSAAQNGFQGGNDEQTGDYVLCVGTLEGRKNHLSLVKVWIRLHKRLKMNTPRLLLVGRMGWKIDDLLALLNSTDNVSGFVTIVENASDLEIARFFENCLFSIYPSYYEGWGLPVGESLWHGKTCVTSKVSALPEVGGDLCVYVDPYNTDDIYKKVLDLIEHPQKRVRLEQKIAKTRLRTWADVAADINTELGLDES